MLKHKRIFSVVVLVVMSVMASLPSWGWSLFGGKMTDQDFWICCHQDSEKEIIEAINEGANVNAKNMADVTALMITAARGKNNAVNALLSAGASVNAKDNAGATALMWAVVSDKADIISALLKAGTSLNARNEAGETALMYAAKYGKVKSINALIYAGARDTTDNYGKSTLMHAAESGTPEAVETLLDAGANAKLKDRGGKMAIDYARKNKKLKGWLFDSDALKRLEQLSR